MLTSEPAEYQVRLIAVEGPGFAALHEAIKLASALPEGLRDLAGDALGRIVDGLGDITSEGDPRPTGEAATFELTINPKLTQREADFLAALRAGNFDDIERHAINVCDAITAEISDPNTD